jgi:thioredoxin 1
MDGELFYIETAQALFECIAQDKLVIICCYSDWCPASSQSKPVFERVARQMSQHAMFAKVRTDASTDVASILNVVAIPSFYAFSRSTLLDTVRGSISEEALTHWITELVRLTPESAI